MVHAVGSNVYSVGSPVSSNDFDDSSNEFMKYDHSSSAPEGRSSSGQSMATPSEELLTKRMRKRKPFSVFCPLKQRVSTFGWIEPMTLTNGDGTEMMSSRLLRFTTMASPLNMLSHCSWSPPDLRYLSNEPSQPLSSSEWTQMPCGLE